MFYYENKWIKYEKGSCRIVLITPKGLGFFFDGVVFFWLGKEREREREGLSEVVEEASRFVFLGS